MPFIDRDFINDLSNRVDIIGLINKRVPLKKAGKDYKACCPFHEEKTPSFTVVPSKQIFHCFGCGESGGVIDFIKKFDHLDFVAAVEAVAGESGISVVYDKNVKPIDPSFKRFNALMAKVNDYYKSKLKHSSSKNKAVNYAKKRGISGEIAKRFELGYAEDGWTNLYSHYQDDEQAISGLEKMGLLVLKKDKKSDYYDRFRNRLIFPIHNAKGGVIAFGGRVLKDKDSPKYLNSPETPLFSKSNELYGLYHCRKYSRKIDYILVVEGYMDVIALHQQGITCAVATMGTATTPNHIKILSRSTDTIVFCFDGDKAGRAAAWKALQTSLPMITSGLIIKFLLLPEGEDPDTMIKQESPTAFSRRIEEAQTLSSFLFEHIKSEVQFETIEGKTQFLEKASVLIHQVSYQVYKQQLIEGVAKIIGQDVIHVEKAINQNKPVEQYTPDDISTNQRSSTENQEHNITDSIRTRNINMKGLMSKMISCILNYPSLANDVVEERTKHLPESKVLMELIHSAQIDTDITKELLLQPFENKIKIYKRLQELSVMEPFLSENEAKDEFLSALTAAEKQQERKRTSKDISSARTNAEEKKIMDDIRRRKTPNV